MPEALQVVTAYVDGSNLVVRHRDEVGAVQTLRKRAEYSLFVRTAEMPDDLRRQFRSSPAVALMAEEGSWTRIGFRTYEQREMFTRGAVNNKTKEKVESPFEARGIQVFEGDVDPVRRFFTDTASTVAKPVRGYFDLETDSRVAFKDKTKARILSIALVDETEERQWVGVIDRDTDEAERDLIVEFFAKVDAWGMTQLLAWNGDEFDFPVLQARAKARGVRVEFRNYLWLDHLRLFRRMNLNSSDSGEEKQSMALGAIAQAQIGEGKEEIPADVAARWPHRSLGSLTWELWQAGGEFRDLMGRYNLKDSLLMPRIEHKTGYVALFDTLADVCRVLPDSKGLLPTRQMDGFMLSLGIQRDHRFPTRTFSDDAEAPEQFAGALVLEPRTHGVEQNVHVCDFASLYPSIIITWNMSPETLQPDVPHEDPIPPGMCRSPKTGWCFATGAEGILPAALKTMIAMRKEWSDKQAALPPGTPEWKEAGRRSMAYKVAANSFYGVVGSPYSRFFDRRVAESVTQNGVWLLESTIEAAEKRGMRVIYGDTDSAFVADSTQTEFGSFVDWCNATLYPDLLQSVGCVENRIKLAYEKAFSVVVFVSAKRYAGAFDHYKGSPAKPIPAAGEAFDKARHSRPEIKGLEYKRGDAAVLARRLQERVIMDLMRKNTRVSHYRDVVRETLSYVMTTELPVEEVQLSKSISKPLSEYERVSATGKPVAPPTHVKIAHAMKKAGQEVVVGTRIPYVVVDGSDGIEAIHADIYDGTQVDRHYLWDNLVYPPTMRLLQAAFPDDDWVTGLERTRPPKNRRVLKGQTGLFDVAMVKREESDEARHLEQERMSAWWREEELRRCRG